MREIRKLSAEGEPDVEEVKLGEEGELEVVTLNDLPAMEEGEAPVISEKIRAAPSGSGGGSSDADYGLPLSVSAQPASSGSEERQRLLASEE